MALTYLKSVEATRVFYNGLGVEFTETFTKRDGTEGKTKYSAFFDADPGITVGTVGDVSGLTSVKARIWTPDDGEPRAIGDIVLNSARFTASEDETPY